MKKFLKSPIFLILCLAIGIVALISWFAFDWQKLPYGWLLLLAAVIPAVIDVADKLISIWNSTKKDKDSGATIQNGNGLNIVGEIKNEAPLIEKQTNIEQQNNYYSQAPVQKEEPQALPDLPARGLLPPVGALPQGSRMAYARNACFTGRKEDLFELANALLFADEVHRVTVTQALAATGLGGIGKTQLAVEFCYRYGRYFEGVHWLNCRDGGLEGEIAECGRGMDLPHWPEKQPEQVMITLRAWEGSRRRLLVLDNLEDPAVLRDWLPRLSHCRLLITARRVDWPLDLGLQTHPLGLLSAEECRALLCALAPRLKAWADAELDAIAEKLGRLPLALDLAGRYLKERESLSPAAYLEALNEQENLLEHSSLLDWVEGSPTRHETSLAATFQLSWEQLEGEDTNKTLARTLFLLAGWCAPNVAIPRELLLQASASQEENFDRAFQLVYALGLLERMESGPAIHPLLVAFTRSLQTVTDQKANLEDLAKTLADLSSKANQSGLPEKFRPLRPHLEILVSKVENVDPPASAPLWNNIGYFLNTIAELDRAQTCCERALHIDEVTYGAEHPEVAVDINNLGSVLQEQGNLEEARACFERALRIDEAAYSADDPKVGTILNNLGSVLKEQGELNKARACFERALRIDEKAYGADHPDVARGVNNLGLVLHDLGKLYQARAYYERALRIDEAAYGEDHPAVAVDVNNLGNVLKDQSDLAGARAFYERALRIDEAAYGADHPNVAIIVNNLGLVLKDQGELDKARTSIECALRIDEAAYGADHPNVARDVNNLGSVLKDQGDLAGARACYERALRIDEPIYGADHPEVATDVNNLGGVLQDQGELDKARACYERTLRIAEAAYGADHPAVGMVVNNLGGVLQEQGDMPGARACFERALRIAEAAYGADHLEVANDVNNLGSVLQEQGELDNARVCYERALRIFEKFLPPDHLNIQIVRKNLETLRTTEESPE